jgi:uncharacterized membrane protein HdeD (DUF308 family)
MTELATASPVSIHRARWKWRLALGALLLAFGIAGIGVTTLAQISSLLVLVFTPLLLASSAMQVVTALSAEKGRERLVHYTAAGLEAALGFFIMAHPFQGIVSLIVVIAIYLVASGLVRLAHSLEAQPRGRGWIAMTGVVALLLGICVLVGWPVAELWFVALCLAVDLLCQGGAWSALALAERQSPQAPAS